MRAANWSSLGKFCVRLAVGHLWCQFLGGSHTLVECYKKYLGSGCMRGVLDYPSFDVRLLERCLQKTASTVFPKLDPFSMTEFIVTRLKGAEHRDWMQSRQSLRKAIETGDLSLPGLVDVVSNIIGVWPLIVFYLKATGKNDSGDSLVVWFSSCRFCFSITVTAYFRFHVQKKGKGGYFYIDQLRRMKFQLFHLVLELCWYSH